MLCRETSHATEVASQTKPPTVTHAPGIIRDAQVLITVNRPKSRQGKNTRKGRGNVAREIHALMQDADNIDAVRDEAIKQEVRASGKFVVARAYVRAVLSHRRTRRYGFDALPKVTGVRLCLIKSPAVGRVIPIAKWKRHRSSDHRIGGFRRCD